MGSSTMEENARKHVWMGAIPLQVQLHFSEVTTLTPPTPFMMLAPRNGYLPLLTNIIKPHFRSALLPGLDTIWFDYQGVPLKWHLPIGVLFDLLCAEPERPWNLTVHFTAYPTDILIPYEGDEAVKWNFFNTLKEASYIMHGNTKNVMNMSQTDQAELWQSVVRGDLEAYDRTSVKLKFGSSLSFTSGKSLTKAPSRRSSLVETDAITSSLSTKTGGDSCSTSKVPVRFYLRNLGAEVEDLIDVSPVQTWDVISFVTKPAEVYKHEGGFSTLRDILLKVSCHFQIARLSPALKTIESHQNFETTQLEDRLEEEPHGVPPKLCTAGDVESDDVKTVESKNKSDSGNLAEQVEKSRQKFPFAFIRVQGIEPSLDLPIVWMAKNLCGPDQFVHVCIGMWDLDNKL